MKRILIVLVLMVTLVLLGSCKDPYINTEIYEVSDNKTVLHRGLTCTDEDCEDSAPDNTIPAFENAAKTNCYGIETDVQETKDGQYVCFHDIDIQYDTDAEGYIHDYKYSEIQEFKITRGANIDKYSDVQIPLLEDYLKICSENNKVPFLDLKDVRHFNGFFKLIHKYFDHEEYFVSVSSERGSYSSTRVYNKKCVCCVDYNNKNYKSLLRSYGGDKNILYNFDVSLDVSKDTIDYYHDNSFKVAAYIINSQEDYDTYINEYDVDYVFASKVWE